MSLFVSNNNTVQDVRKPFRGVVHSLEVKNDLTIGGDLIVKGDLLSTDELQVDSCTILAGVGQEETVTDDCVGGLEIIANSTTQAGIFRVPTTDGGPQWVVSEGLSVVDPTATPNPLTSGDIKSNRGNLAVKELEVGSTGTSYTLPTTKGNLGDVLTLTGTGSTSTFAPPTGGSGFLPLSGGTMTGNINTDPGVYLNSTRFSTDANSGLRYIGTNFIGLYTAGTPRMQFSTTSALVSANTTFNLLNNSQALSTTGGSLRCFGGASFQGNIFVRDLVNIGATSSVDYVLPATRGLANQVLTQTDGVGNTAWVTPTTSAVSDLQSAYEESKSSPQITTDGVNGPLTIENGGATDTVNVLEVNNLASGTTFSVAGNGDVKASTLTATTVTGDTGGKILFNDAPGSLYFQSAIGTTFCQMRGDTNQTIFYNSLFGGAMMFLDGASDTIIVDAPINQTDTTQSTSTTTGSIKSAGGIGAVKDVHVGGEVTSKQPFLSRRHNASQSLTSGILTPLNFSVEVKTPKSISRISDSKYQIDGLPGTHTYLVSGYVSFQPDNKNYGWDVGVRVNGTTRHYFEGGGGADHWSSTPFTSTMQLDFGDEIEITAIQYSGGTIVTGFTGSVYANRLTITKLY